MGGNIYAAKNIHQTNNFFLCSSEHVYTMEILIV